MMMGTSAYKRVARDGSRKLETVLAGHHHVHQDEVGLFLGQAAKGIFGVLGVLTEKPFFAAGRS
jgi:hypothetical protein